MSHIRKASVTLLVYYWKFYWRVRQNKSVYIQYLHRCSIFGLLLRALGSNAIKNPRKHIWICSGFQNCHRAAAFKPGDVESEAYPEFTLPCLQIWFFRSRRPGQGILEGFPLPTIQDWVKSDKSHEKGWKAQILIKRLGYWTATGRIIINEKVKISTWKQQGLHQRKSASHSNEEWYSNSQPINTSMKARHAASKKGIIFMCIELHRTGQGKKKHYGTASSLQLGWLL